MKEPATWHWFIFFINYLLTHMAFYFLCRFSIDLKTIIMIEYLERFLKFLQ